MRRTVGALIAGFGASATLLGMELARLRRVAGPEVVDLETIRSVVVDLAPDHLLLGLFAAAALIGVTGGRALIGKRPATHALAPAIAPMPVFFWVAFELAKGRGIVREGLGPVVVMTLPLLAGAGVWLLAWATERLLRWGRLTGCLLLVAALVTLGWLNRNRYVGYYQPVHEALELFELFGCAALIGLLIGSDGQPQRPIRALAGFLIGLGLGLQGLSIWPVGSWPGEELRSLYDRAGFHSRALLRWRARLDPREVDDGGFDEALVRKIEDWNAAALTFERRLDELLPKRRSYNLLLVSIDTLRVDRLGCFGANPSRTPCIDELAKEATVFENAYSQYPSTALSTESLFHGRYPRATGIYRKNKGELSAEDLRVLRISEVARENSMRTAAAIAFTDEWMSDPLFSRSLESFELVNPKRQGAPRLDGEYFADSAMAAMTELERERFFLWFHLFDPHHAYVYRPGFALGDDAQGRYDGEVRYADAQLGRVIEFMKQRGLWDNTVVVLTSDHGEAFGEGGLRYHGSRLQEVQIHIPLLIRVPGLPGQRVSEIVENVDLYQTLSSLLALQGASPNQSSDLAPLILRHDEFAASFPSFAYSELPDDVRELSVASSSSASYREGRWKLIRFFSLDYSQLYDLETDPTEERDLAKQEPAQRLYLERRLRTMYQRVEQFGRRLSSEDIRREKVEVARSQLLDANPYKIFEGLNAVAEDDLRELQDHIDRMAHDPKEYPELRTRALRLCARWRRPGWREEAIAWLEDDNPVFRWVGVGLMVDECLRIANGARGLEPEELDRIEAAIRAEDRLPMPALWAALRLVVGRLRNEPHDPAALELVAHVLADPLSDPKLRRRLVLASAHVLADPLRDVGLFIETDERQQLLETLWAANRRDLWLEYARILLPDRYLPAPLKESILGRTLAQFPTEVVEELAVPLLARWDPAFHEKATKLLGERLGEERVRVLQRCHGRISDGRDLLASGNHLAAVAAFAAASAYVPDSQAGVAVELDRLRSLIALDRWDEAQALRGRIVDRAVASGAASLIHRAQALAGYLNLPRGLDSSARIRVLSVAPARENRRFVASGGTFALDVEIANEHDRPLLGDPWKHGGRLRVVWKSQDGGDKVYGSEYVLERELLPGERRRLRMPALAPGRPGAWQARIILNEHEGDRFHVFEDEGGEFAITVVPPHEGSPVGDWLPVEMLSGYSFDPSLEGYSASPDDGAMALVAESYEGAFRTGVLGFDGKVKTLRLLGRWFSGIEGANLVRVEMVPVGGFKKMPAVFADLHWDGSAFDLAIPLPPAVGLYQVEIRVGYRQGLLELDRVAIE